MAGRCTNTSGYQSEFSLIYSRANIVILLVLIPIICWSGDVNRIIQYIEGTGKYKFWDDLAEWTDTFGGRLCSSEALEHSIGEILDMIYPTKLKY